MARVKTFTAGGSGLPADFNSIQDDYEAALASYKHIVTGFAAMPSGSGVLKGMATAGQLYPPTGTFVADGLFYIDPADYPATSPRATKMRIRGWAHVQNTNNPGTSFTVGLYPVTLSAGNLVAGTIVTGSGASVGTPTTAVLSQGVGADFAVPAAGFYILAVLPGGVLAVNSDTLVGAFLQMRQV